MNRISRVLALRSYFQNASRREQRSASSKAGTASLPSSLRRSVAASLGLRAHPRIHPEPLEPRQLLAAAPVFYTTGAVTLGSPGQVAFTRTQDLAPGT